MSSAQKRYDEALARLQQLAQRRQKYTQAMYERMMREERKRAKAAEEAQRYRPEAALGGALRGAAMGFIGSGFNPMGAAVGGLAGLVGGGIDEKMRASGSPHQPFAEASPLLMQAWMAQQRNQQMQDWMNSRTAQMRDYPSISPTGAPSLLTDRPQLQMDPDLYDDFSDMPRY